MQNKRGLPLDAQLMPIRGSSRVLFSGNDCAELSASLFVAQLPWAFTAPTGIAGGEGAIYLWAKLPVRIPPGDENLVTICCPRDMPSYGDKESYRVVLQPEENGITDQITIGPYCLRDDNALVLLWQPDAQESTSR